MRFLLLVLLPFLGGCSVFLPDSSHSKKIADFDLNQHSFITFTQIVPKGYSELIFYMPRHDCTKPVDATINFTIRGNDGYIKKEFINMRDMTWEKRGNGLVCTGIAFVPGKEGHGRPLALTMERHGELIFDLDIMSRENYGNIKIWLAKNSRLDYQKVLGDK